MTALALPPELEPNGPISKAHCKYCGREKEYDTAYGYRYNNKKDDG